MTARTSDNTGNGFELVVPCAKHLSEPIVRDIVQFRVHIGKLAGAVATKFVRNVANLTASIIPDVLHVSTPA